MIAWLAVAAATLLAALPAWLFLRNLALYQAPPLPAGSEPPGVSILLPARNEEGNIVAAVEAALASRGVELEVIVLDDQSSDRTPELVEALAQRHAGLRLERSGPLPPGWCGKQHACWTLAQRAKFPWLLFVDADVRLEPEAAVRLVAYARASGASLVSGIPRQETAGWLDALLVPLIHFVLLGFLPLERMRRSRDPAYGAGCGQLFLANRDDYFTAGGHRAISASLHDGPQLPRAFRRAGLHTDLCDITSHAHCRMFASAAETWRGLGRNATEGLASPTMIVPASLLLLGGQVAPIALLALGVAREWSAGLVVVSLGGTALSYLPRVAGARRFKQSWRGAALHPLGVALLVALQWQALGAKLRGRPAVWRERAYAGRTAPTASQT